MNSRVAIVGEHRILPAPINSHVDVGHEKWEVRSGDWVAVVEPQRAHECCPNRDR